MSNTGFINDQGCAARTGRRLDSALSPSRHYALLQTRNRICMHE